MTQNGPSQPTGNAVKREAREQETTASEIALTGSEREAVAENSSLTVYSIIMREGQEELERPMLSLWWSGIAAGIGISS